jgi:hypothetical protein
MVERLANEVVAYAADLDRIQKALQRSDDDIGASHVFHEQQPTAFRSSGMVQRAKAKTTVSKWSSG